MESPRTRRRAQTKRIEADQIGKTVMLNKSASTKIVEEARPENKEKKAYQQQQQQQLVIIDQIRNNKSSVNKRQVWDCGSSLYDSFELKSFNRQLDSAIQASSRTISMPHLPDPRAPAPAPAPLQTIPTKKMVKHQVVPKKLGGKVSKSFQKMFKSVFGSSSKTAANNTTNIFVNAKTDEKNKLMRDGFYIYDGSKSVRVLSTIPETHETDHGYNRFSPVDARLVRRAASERFTASSIGASCA